MKSMEEMILRSGGCRTRILLMEKDGADENIQEYFLAMISCIIIAYLEALL
jgi:hypothetical protein